MKKPWMLPRGWRRRPGRWFAASPSVGPATEALRSLLNLETLEPRSLPSFLAPVNYDAGISPNSVAVADLNGDGIPDIVAANGNGSADENGGTVTVLLGNGDGSFQAPQSYPAGFRDALQVAVGDFNGDGTPDLAVTSYDQNGNFELSVLLGNGDGSFQAPHSYSLDFNPSSIAVGDFNGDGRLDLALSGFKFGVGGEVEVLLGNGDGSFQVNTAVPIFTGSSPATSVAVGDVNEDGRPDLIVANDGTFPDVPNPVRYRSCCGPESAQGCRHQRASGVVTSRRWRTDATTERLRRGVVGGRRGKVGSGAGKDGRAARSVNRLRHTGDND